MSQSAAAEALRASVVTRDERSDLARGDAMLALRTAQSVEWMLHDDDPAQQYVTDAIHALANARHILFGGDPTQRPHRDAR